MIAAFLENLESLEMSLSGSQPNIKEKSGERKISPSGEMGKCRQAKNVYGRTDRFTDAFIIVLRFATGGGGENGLARNCCSTPRLIVLVSFILFEFEFFYLFLLPCKLVK